jgi:Aldo/keto reductase family
MPFRQIEIPSLGRRLSNIMASPSSSEPDSHDAGLDAFHSLGGNCIHLHGEGGEQHSRQATGNWLQKTRLRERFFLYTQICHDDWDEIHRRPVSRFTPSAISEDITIDLELLGTEYLDSVYLDDAPEAAFEAIIEALGEQIKRRRIRAFGVRNWSAARIRAANAFAASRKLPPITSIVTTELSLLRAAGPLWPEYLCFDVELRGVVTEFGLAVFAHVSDLTMGQVLFGGEDSICRMRPEWQSRWVCPTNDATVSRVLAFASEQGLTAREVNVATF